MKFINTKIKDLSIIKLEPFQDYRGKFTRIFCKDELRQIGLTKEIVQVNQSLTKIKGAIRGMHFQYPPDAEIKIIKCVNGTIFDVAIDLRKNSSTFLKWHGEVLTGENPKMIYIPEGFAHGFQAMEDNSEIIYFNTAFYNPQNEGGIRYNDPKINIDWPIEITDVSEKDRKHSLIDSTFSGLII